ncbi:MAG TPA: hypothetical protein PKI61_03125 [bacterium]|nr:hypothetical protein [bacterium]HPT29875.1 hypothetical protein [bacterium]
MKDQIIHVLSAADFKTFHQQNSRDFKNAPTPAITILGKVNDQLVIKLIAIDESFLPQGDEDEAAKYLECLRTHELSEADFVLSEPSRFYKALENIKAGRPVSPEPHLYALDQEMKRAKELGILSEYCAHWDEWLKEKLTEMTDEKAKEATLERQEWRNQAAQEIQRVGRIKENYAESNFQTK